MKKYEIMYILDPKLEEEAIEKEIQNIEDLLKKNGAEKIETDKWGLREFAYEIKDHKKGYYVVLNFETQNSETVNEFNRLTRINKKVLRYLVINK